MPHQVGVQLANRTGALNEIEYSEFVVKAQAFADTVNGAPEFPEMLDEVARAKGEIFGGLTRDGVAVLPDDEPRLEREAAAVPEGRKRRFGFRGGPGIGKRQVRILEVVPAGAAAPVRISEAARIAETQNRLMRRL